VLLANIGLAKKQVGKLQTGWASLSLVQGKMMNYSDKIAGNDGWTQ
jgi:hypothetical protein